MRIAIDGTTLRFGWSTGPGRYTEQLVRCLAAQRDTEVIVLSHRAVETREGLPEAVRVQVPYARVPRLVWLHALVPRSLGRLQPDVAHFPSGFVPFRAPVPVVLTLHSLGAGATTATAGGRAWRTADRALGTAAAIIVGSEPMAHEVKSRYPALGTRVQVVPAAPSPAFRPIHDVAELERARFRYQLPDRFILYVGPVEIHPYLSALLEGVSLRRRSRDLPLPLVCVGAHQHRSLALERLIDRLQLEAAVRFTGQVPFADMPALYNLAEICVPGWTSWGLPLLEALACGTTVVAHRAMVPADIGPTCVHALEHLDPVRLGDALSGLAMNRERRQRLAVIGLERVRARSWERCAAETMRVYRQVA